MPLLCLDVFRSCSRDNSDSSSIFHVEGQVAAPRQSAEHPPPLSSTAANLFDTFPRVAFGGYRRYYESGGEKPDDIGMSWTHYREMTKLSSSS